MRLDDTYTLSNGVPIPQVGLGTWKIPNGAASAAVQHAVDLGYRHIDTAQAYDNEAGVGEGLRASGVPREQLFLTTKLAAEVKSYEEAVRRIDGSLQALGLDVIDLMLIHCPQPWAEYGQEERYFEGNRQAWRALEEAYEAGKLRAIGVSNFQAVDLDNIFEVCAVAPMVNQILVHIGETPLELIQYNRARGILVEAYSPLAHGRLMRDARVEAVASRYGVSVPQLAIRYTLQLGLLPLPKSETPAHMKANAELGFVISEADMETLKGM